jgi:hypothetical protein
MELERDSEHTDNSATGPAPVSPSPQAAAQSSTLETVELQISEPWRNFWNPLKLSATATSEFNATSGKWCCCLNSNVVYSLYLYVVYSKHFWVPAVPMLIFLGNPLKEQDQSLSAPYFIIATYLFFPPLAMAIVDYFFLKRFRIQASFFKIVLFAEMRKEGDFKLPFKFCHIIIVGSVVVVRILSARILESCLEIQKNGSESDITSKEIRDKICGTPTDYANITCDCYLPPEGSPGPLSISFWLLLISYLIFCLNVVTYNDCFADHMFPSMNFMKRHYPDEYKIANQLYGGSWNIMEEFVCEPNIPIRPVYCGCTWFLTDSRENLRNIMLVCDRVAVLWQVHYSQLTPEVLPTEKIRDFRSSKIAASDQKLLDDSLKWEYVISHCSIFRIILIFPIGTFKT